MDTVLRMTVEFDSSAFHASRDTDWPHDSWFIVLKFDGHTMRLDYHTGTGLHVDGRPTPPSIGDVLSSLASGAQSVEGCETFEDWADNMGENPDPRKAERTYHAVCREARKLGMLLGDTFYRVVLNNAPDDGDWSEFEGTSIDLGPYA